MKTIRISDEVHRKLTEILGKLTAKTGKIQTYDSTIKALIDQIDGNYSAKTNSTNTTPNQNKGHSN